MSRIKTITGAHEFAGWETWDNEPFDEKAGPFYHRIEPDGRLVAAMRADRSHTNGLGVVHGGCLVTLADYAMFTLAVHGQEEEAMTISISSEFVGSAREGDLILAYPEVVRRGRRIMFLRGLLYVGDRPVLNFSGSMMRVAKA